MPRQAVKMDCFAPLAMTGWDLSQNNNAAAKPVTRIDVFQTIRTLRRARAHSRGHRPGADAVPELGVQPDRGEARAAGCAADAAGADPLRRRAAGHAVRRLAARGEIFRA